MTWAQRLKRVFNVDIKMCSECGGAVKVIACIEDPVVIEKILPHLDEKAAPAATGLLAASRAPPVVCVAPGKNHWKLFVQFVEEVSAQGNDVADAYLAALALEWDCDWVTTDKGFHRFKGLRVRHPLK
jgi:predicted nucleic acid-binding protein